MLSIYFVTFQNGGHFYFSKFNILNNLQNLHDKQKDQNVKETAWLSEIEDKMFN